MMSRLLKLGIAGSLITGLCCFTPLLPAVLGALGLTGALGWLYNDLVLLPLLAGFVLLSGFALWRMKRAE